MFVWFGKNNFDKYISFVPEEDKVEGWDMLLKCVFKDLKVSVICMIAKASHKHFLLQTYTLEIFIR